MRGINRNESVKKGEVKMQLTARAKYSYGIGALGKDLVYGIVGTYLMFYFTDVIGLAPAFVGTLLMQLFYSSYLKNLI